jgi:hypothetical protein
MYIISISYYIHDKITAIWLVKRSAIISLIALSGIAIVDFRDGCMGGASLQADVLVERRGEYEKERLPSNIKIGIPPPCIN